jgi:hypothetical protein
MVYRDIWAGLTLDLFARPNTTADVRAAVAAAIQPLMKGMTNMALNLDKLTVGTAVAPGAGGCWAGVHDPHGPTGHRHRHDSA